MLSIMSSGSSVRRPFRVVVPVAVSAVAAAGLAAVVTGLTVSEVSAAGERERDSRALSAVRSSLERLSGALVWNEDASSSYGAIAPAAADALAKMELVVKVSPELIPRGESFVETLERLDAESSYLREVSSVPGYEPGVLDSVMFLTGSVAEWQHAVVSIGDQLTDPSPVEAGAPVDPLAVDVDSSAPAGTVFRDREDGPELVVVPAGSYRAGSTTAEHEQWGVPAGRRHFELPERDVAIGAPLAFGRTEVTVAQFQAFVDDTGYQVRGGARWWDPDDATAMVFNADLDYLNPGFPQSSNSPAVALTRQDATAYVEWLSETTGQMYRLPTEDEWEWAARAGSSTAFPWGDEIEAVNQYANSFDATADAASNFRWSGTPVEDDYPHTAPVGSFEPNAFGLYDVIGNAREFTADDWVADLSSAQNDGSARTPEVPFPVLRGGAWNYQPQNLRLDYRSAYFSSEVATNMFGFRVVREL